MLASSKCGQAIVGVCIKIFVVANCLGGVIEADIQVEICFLTETLFSILIISEHTSYMYSSHQYNTVVYQHSLNKEICIQSECRISAGSLRYR